MPAKESKPPTKAEVQTSIAGKTGLTKGQVISVLDALEDIMKKSLKDHRQFTLNGLLKVVVAHKKATESRQGRNPFTGEDIVIKAKPAHDVVRVRTLKKLKEMI